MAGRSEVTGQWVLLRGDFGVCGSRLVLPLVLVGQERTFSWALSEFRLLRLIAEVHQCTLGGIPVLGYESNGLRMTPPTFSTCV